MFKVSMNEDEKKLGNSHNIEVMVDVKGAPRDLLEKYALKAYKVELQGQIRPNWSDFIEGNYPKELTFGQALFSKKAAKPVTMEDHKAAVAADMAKLSETERLDALLMSGFITQEMYDGLIEAAVAREEAAE